MSDQPAEEVPSETQTNVASPDQTAQPQDASSTAPSTDDPTQDNTSSNDAASPDQAPSDETSTEGASADQSADDDLEGILTSFHQVHMDSFDKIREWSRKRHEQTKNDKALRLQELLASIEAAKKYAEALL